MACSFKVFIAHILLSIFIILGLSANSVLAQDIPYYEKYKAYDIIEKGSPTLVTLNNTFDINDVLVYYNRMMDGKDSWKILDDWEENFFNVDSKTPRTATYYAYGENTDGLMIMADITEQYKLANLSLVIPRSLSIKEKDNAIYASAVLLRLAEGRIGTGGFSEEENRSMPKLINAVKGAWYGEKNTNIYECTYTNRTYLIMRSKDDVNGRDIISIYGNMFFDEKTGQPLQLDELHQQRKKEAEEKRANMKNTEHPLKVTYHVDALDGPMSVSQTVFHLKLGQSVQIVKDANSQDAGFLRVMGNDDDTFDVIKVDGIGKDGGKGSYHGFTITANMPGEAHVQLIPDYGDWDHAVNLDFYVQ